MSESKTIFDLINVFEISFWDILNILKAMGNEKRFRILITLLSGIKNFSDLKIETDLKKTALSNHLTQLIDVNLISKPEYNQYKLTRDGELFLRALENAFKKSDLKIKRNIEELQQRKFSNDFVKSFFG